MIEEPAQRQSISACVQVLAGLRFEKSLIQGLFRREIMKESVIYQDILQEGLRQGQQEGLRQGLQQVVQLIIDTLEVRFSETPSDITEQLMNLTPEQLRQLHRLAMTCSSLPEFLADLPD
jgi:predicted transposase YdaD